MSKDELIIHKMFSRAAERSSVKVALQCRQGDRWFRMTYAEVDSLSRKVAAFLLTQQHMEKQELAALVLENRPEWAVIYFGIMQAGLVCVPMDHRSTPDELENLIFNSGLKTVFTSHSIYLDKFRDNQKLSFLQFIILDYPGKTEKNIFSFSDIEKSLSVSFSMPCVGQEDTASLIYTSGTTARPKAVLLSHRNICSNFMSISKMNICNASDNMLSVLPLHHTYAFMVTLIVPLFLGAEVTYCATLKSADIMDTIKETSVTILTGVPQLLNSLHKGIFERIKKIPPFLLPVIRPFIRVKIRRSFPELRLLVSGGARLEPRIARDLTLLGLKVVEGYGLTETSPVVTLNPPEKVKFGSVGRPIPEVEIRLLDADSSGIGVVMIKGPNVFQGYFKQPDITGEVIRDSWFYSGDLGRIDEEGYLFLVGRQKEVIVLSSGKNIYPEELEEYYGKSPYIKEICILSRAEEKLGNLTEVLYAVIVPDLEYFRQRNEKNIRNRIRWELENAGQKLPTYDHIMGFLITRDELPRTALKKIKRYEVKTKFLEGKEIYSPPEKRDSAAAESSEDAELVGSDTAKKIMGYLSYQLKRPVSLDSHMEIDLGIDSLTRVELGLGLGAVLNTSIPDEALYGASTVRELIVNIQNARDEKQGFIQQWQSAQMDWNRILNDLPHDGEFLCAMGKRHSLAGIMATVILKSVFLFILRLFWRLSIKGRRFLPRHGPYLVCPNHSSYLDGVIVACSVPVHQCNNLFFLGYSDIFEHLLLRWATKMIRVIPVNPLLHLVRALQCVAFALKNKKIVCLFPEGRRSADVNPGDFKKGVGIIIKELDIPVVPVYIKGSYEAWPRTRILPRLHRLEIVFGPPIGMRELTRRTPDDAGKDDYEVIACRLRDAVMNLAY